MDTEFWKKLAYMAVGYAMVNPEKIKELTDQLAAAGKMTEAEGNTFIQELVAKGKDMKSDLEDRMHKISTDVLNRMNLPTRDEVQELWARLDELEKKMK